MTQVFAVPAFTDNYIWVLHNGRHAAVVDPGDGGAALRALDARQLQLVAVLITHHHWDHTDGIEDLLQGRSLPVYGPAGEARRVTRRLREDDVVELPELGLRFRVLDVPGHTRGHIAYTGHGMVFCGDTLFAGGCGRLFEGTPAQMHASLTKLAALPPATRVYCAHEYTEANLRFAATVEPHNDALSARLGQVKRMRAAGEITLPTTIAQELATNPFLRVRERSVIESAESRAGKRLASPAEVFACVRAWKDSAG